MGAMDPIARNNVTVRGNLLAPRTILFSHGFGTDQTAWAAIAAALGEHFRIVLFDHLGQGGSAPEAFEQHRYLRLDSYARDVVEIIDRLGLQDVIAVGHSMGGMACLLGSLEKPRLFSRLVLICASPRYRNDLDYVGGMCSEDVDRVYSAMHDNYSGWAKSVLAAMADFLD